MAGLRQGDEPHPWQIELAQNGTCENRLIRVPTGFGKTLGVLGAWLWNRIERRRDQWPRRLVWCLPMRVLVEQAAAEIDAAIARLTDAVPPIQVHCLMGGAAAGDWHINPDREAVLVGTQDMLLSRALNRGYGAPRARWPMDFGLLNQDCLWVLDEVQLMDVGLATSAQLQAFREQDREDGRAFRSCASWWMSATLQDDWVQSSPDTAAAFGALPVTRVAAPDRQGPLWNEGELRKPIRVERADSASARAVAQSVVAAHVEGGSGRSGPTLVIVNRVDRATEIYQELCQQKKRLPNTDLRLVHSRFRPAERVSWREAFLCRSACSPGTDRIVVATQVVEAGVDISAAVLMTELAPWPSLVQRFGRCARWGGAGQVTVFDGGAKDDKTAAPYRKAELDSAREALSLLTDVAPLHLECFEETHSELLARLYPYEPAHLLLRHELNELFDTSPDLSGADVDISRFIRSGDERDLQVFWRDLERDTLPDPATRARRDELCAVPVFRARAWLCGKGTRLLPGTRAWVWDWVEGEWKRPEKHDLYPGQTVLVASDTGGYDPKIGWSPDSEAAVVPVAQSESAEVLDDADNLEDDESLSVAGGWQTIAFHGRETGRQADRIAEQLVPSLRAVFELAGRWHDAGKAHVAFQSCLKQPHPYEHQQIAKAPKQQWLRGSSLYRMPDGSRRKGFRHELASTLALFALVRRCHPDHAGLLGPWRELLCQAGLGQAMPAAPTEPVAHGALEREVVALQADALDLLLYLVCSHHGKVRMAWHASPADQAANDDALRIRGVRSGDILPPLVLADAGGTMHLLAESELVLDPAAVGINPHTGKGWTERVLGLLQQFGPFTLAWLEAIMRAADQQATRDKTLLDPALRVDNVPHGLEGSDPSLARSVGSREASAPVGEHSSQRGAQFRVRRRAGGPEGDRNRTRAPANATRYLETRFGTLSYLELAPHLASSARAIESEIESGAFDDRLLDEYLVLELHRCLCASLTPQIAGWRRSEVAVGSHNPPQPHLVPQLMLEYGRDLQARLAAVDGDERLLETLAFAEGRLLSIHPFADFNGRVTRLFLRLLLRRLDLPVVDLVPDPDRPDAYFAALRAGDQRNWKPLCEVWRERFEGINP